MQVNVNTAQASMNHAPSAGSSTASNADAINAAAQTLSDLKKQRSMHRVAQQSPRSSDNQRESHGHGQPKGNSNSSSHHKQKQKEDNNHRHSSKRSSKNGGGRNGHRSSNVKKFASPTEVVGPSPKKVGCCRVM